MWCVQPLSVTSTHDFVVCLVTRHLATRMVGARLDAKVTLDGLGARCDLLVGDLRMLIGVYTVKYVL